MKGYCLMSRLSAIAVSNVGIDAVAKPLRGGLDRVQRYSWHRSGPGPRARHLRGRWEPWRRAAPGRRLHERIERLPVVWATFCRPGETLRAPGPCSESMLFSGAWASIASAHLSGPSRRGRRISDRAAISCRPCPGVLSQGFRVPRSIVDGRDFWRIQPESSRPAMIRCSPELPCRERSRPCRRASDSDPDLIPLAGLSTFGALDLRVRVLVASATVAVFCIASKTPGW